MPIARLSITFVALVVCAWFALGVRQAYDLREASAIITQSRAPTATELTHAASLLGSAGTLNPDSEVSLVRARLAQLENDLARAVRIAEGVVRDEPQNVVAWYDLATLAGRDPRTLLRAFREIHKLAPPPPQS